MIKYILKRIWYSFFVILGVLSLIFFVFQVLPSDPARMMLSQRDDVRQLELIKKKYGFDKSISEQYFLYLNDISPISIHETKDKEHYTFLDSKYSFISIFSILDKSIVFKIPYLRYSYVKSGKSVVSIIHETFPSTLVLAITSIVFASIFGSLLGIFSSVFENTIFDKLIMIFSTLGMSLPSFLSSILIAWFFAFVLNKYTGLSMTGSLYEVDSYGRGEYLDLKNLILPAFTLGIRPLAVIIQLTRNSMLDVFKSDYVRTATAKGLSRFKVIFKHVFINALNPVVTGVSGWFASLLAGSVFVEYIFGWNGMGKEIVEALNNLDMPLVMGIVMFIAFIFVLINLFVDIIYVVLDPRIKLN